MSRIEKDKGENSMSVEKRFAILDKNVSEALSKADEMDEDKFTAVLSNPPYQVSTDPTSNVNVWQHFVFIATEISTLSSLIHPGRWVNPKKSMMAIRDQIIDSGLSQIIYYTDSVFDNVDIDGGISIVLISEFDRSKRDTERKIKISKNNGVYKQWNPNDKFFLNSMEEGIYSMVEDKLSVTMNDRVVGNLGSIGSVYFGVSKNDFEQILVNNKEEVTSPVKIWANKGFGKGTRYDWYFADESSLSKVPIKLLKSNKVMIDKVGHADTSKEKNNIFNNLPVVLNPNEISLGNQFYLIPDNDTVEDCLLIKSYMMTRFVRMLMNVTQKDLYVRGLDNVPDYALLKDDLLADGETEFSDEWLFKYFDLTNEMIEYIKLRISVKK